MVSTIVCSPNKSMLTIICLFILGVQVSAIRDPITFPPIYQVPENAQSDSFPITIAPGVLPDAPNFVIRTYEYNGSVPGPTIHVRPGQTLIIEVNNGLTGTQGARVFNEPSGEQNTNLHMHGLYISGERPSDDVTIDIQAGSSLSYTIEIPPEQLPGTHWLHPHSHGSTAVQVAGGAAMAVIVDGEEELDGFPQAVMDAPDILLVLMEFNSSFIDPLLAAFRKNGQIPWFNFFTNPSVNVTDITSGLADDLDGMILVNGQFLPIIDFVADKWHRLRFINAGWENDPMEIKFISSASPETVCEMALLAKDGIFIQDFPRDITESGTYIPLGGRGDVLVRCEATDNEITEYKMQIKRGIDDATATIKNAATVNVSPDPETIKVDLDEWTPPYPDYLEDLRGKEVSPGCTCDTIMNITFPSFNINGFEFDAAQSMHEAYLNAVVERNIASIPEMDHPYHQHVYPFQLIELLSDNINPIYDKVGDWHDTFQGKSVIRYLPKKYITKVMVHCHKLVHEDNGMMSIDYVKDALPSNPCKCTNPGDPPMFI